MLVVGLTGGIASGKSSVSSILKSHSLPLVDLDVLAREVVLPGTSSLSSLVSHFGPQILLPDRTLDREKLGSIVFGNEQERKVLNGILHPAIRKLLVKKLIRHWLRGEKLVVVDAPLLIEAGLWKFCGAIMVVYCSEPLQLQRLQSRNSLSAEQARSRLSSQLALSEKLLYADYVLDNSGPLSDLTPQVERVITKLNQRAGWSWRLNWVIPPLGLMRGLWRVFWRLYVQGVGKERRAGHKTKGERLPRGGGGEQIEMHDRRGKANRGGSRL
ncbi:BQ2448_320 [Microbotryum intermedium]|uniref:BQ2448_320 protein n=1 Tax=Microbotryum intermedium TaxID=269621 RepID=A0A238F608_9BASI|nr:BQ2448_320 [Microbotryum intermedium]